jgi:mono/diheme cytochrome c family protein
MHLEMPPWQGRLDSNEIDLLAAYVVNPTGDTQGEQLFQQYCTNCHGQRVPKSQSLEQARQTIQEGGAHKTMPVWGDVLTSEQIDALVTYTLNSEKDSSQQEGQDLFAKNCSGCHGALGEGGPNPARQGDIIAPISSAEYLKTRDDLTLRTIISEGQPNFGMSPFGLSNGGPFDDEEIGALVSYIRSWEDNPPVELPPEVTVDTVSLDSSDLYAQVCAQCHGAEGEGGVGPALRDAKFQSTTDDEAIFKSIDQGHTDSPMIGWGSILSSEQIQGLVTYIRKLGEPELEKMAQGPSFAEDVLPILKKRCTACHGSDGGWKGTSYENVMTTGDHGPVVVAGDVDGSLLAQKILGTQSQGSAMPPMSELKDDQIQTILDWINAGAQDN